MLTKFRFQYMIKKIRKNNFLGDDNMTERRKTEKKKPDNGGKKKRIQKKQRAKMSWKQWLIVAAVLAVIYIGGTIYFSSHFFFGTKLNGMSCQFKTVEEAKAMMSQYVEEYQITLKQRKDREDVIDSKELSLQFVDDGDVDRCKEEQKGYQWITAIWRRYHYENTSFSYDENKLEETVKNLSCFDKANVTSPHRAYPAYNETTKKYEIVEEVMGNKVVEEKLLETVQAAIKDGKKVIDIDKAGCYKEPKWYKDDPEVIGARDTMNKYIGTVITYDMDYTEEVVDVDRIHEWISVDSDCKVTVERAKVREFLLEMAYKYNTVGSSRDFTTPSGSKIKVSGGTYGWRLNQEDETDELCKLIKEGKEQKRTPLYLSKGLPRDKDGKDLGDTYIAISIAAQTMWYYKDGECMISTSVVTGNTSKNRGTPTGVYAIAYKQRDYTLTGDNYASHVDYWMPFYEWKGIGIHDASWRNSFGGSIYKTNGSHGCVNTPYYAVQYMFQNVETGTPVVVY